MTAKNSKKIFNETGKEFISFLEKEKPVCPGELDSGWKEIRRKSIRIKRKKIISRTIYSAAVILSLVFFSTYIYKELSPSTDTEELLFNSGISNNNIKEVVLLTEGQNVILENETEVEYNKEGKVIIKDQVISSVTVTDKKDKKTKTPPWNQIIVPHGKRSYLVLTDGTRLAINSGSRVAYPPVFDDDKREIFVQGEVYFQVKKDNQRPFYVKTDKFDVRVLGTSFNISAYKEDAESSIVLVEGSVEMINNKNETVKITPEQKLSINDSGFSITEVDVNEYISWKDNILYLGNYKSCGEILKCLARQYDVVIEYDKRTENMHIGGKLDICEQIEDVLDILSISGKFTYERQSGRIIIQSKQILN